MAPAALRVSAPQSPCLATVFEFERQQIVGARPAEVDGGDRDAAACSSLCEAKPGIDHQRGADDKHGVRAFEMRLGGVDLVARDVFTEERDVGLEDAAAGCARR
jgi:hypothetical protein